MIHIAMIIIIIAVLELRSCKSPNYITQIPYIGQPIVGSVLDMGYIASGNINKIFVCIYQGMT